MSANNNLKKSSSRLISVQILYEMEINGKSFELISKRFSKEYFSEIMSDKNNVMPDKNYIKDIVKALKSGINLDIDKSCSPAPSKVKSPEVKLAVIVEPLSLFPVS